MYLQRYGTTMFALYNAVIRVIRALLELYIAIQEIVYLQYYFRRVVYIIQCLIQTL